MYLVIHKCVTAVILSNFSRHYLLNRSTSDIRRCFWLYRRTLTQGTFSRSLLVHQQKHTGTHNPILIPAWSSLSTAVKTISSFFVTAVCAVQSAPRSYSTWYQLPVGICDQRALSSVQQDTWCCVIETDDQQRQSQAALVHRRQTNRQAEEYIQKLQESLTNL